MLTFIGYRMLQMIPLLFLISVIVFIIIQLPPGDFLTTYVDQLEASGSNVAESTIAHLRAQYGLDQPLYTQYWIWISSILSEGDFGTSIQWNRPVSEILGERIWLTIALSIVSLLIVWLIAVPVGIYSATHQYSPLDYLFSFLGFIGLAVPGFLIALVLVFAVFNSTGVAITGLFSPEYQGAPWSWDKVLDMLPRMIIPVVIVGLSGTAALIRVMRGMMLEELTKQYVTTARAKGLGETRLLLKYPVRIAVNPMVSTIGWTLPALISGEAVVSIVLNLPTTGPILLKALMVQDMYLAGSFLLILSAFTVVGTLISDILLAIVDPRIRYGGAAQ